MWETVDQSSSVTVLPEPQLVLQLDAGGQLSVQQSFGICSMHGFETLSASTVPEEDQLHSSTGIMVLNKATSVWVSAACFS